MISFLGFVSGMITEKKTATNDTSAPVMKAQPKPTESTKAPATTGPIIKPKSIRPRVASDYV
jgi:hypothetical protein